MIILLCIRLDSALNTVRYISFELIERRITIETWQVFIFEQFIYDCWRNRWLLTDIQNVIWLLSEERLVFLFASCAFGLFYLINVLKVTVIQQYLPSDMVKGESFLASEGPVWLRFIGVLGDHETATDLV